MSRFSSNHHVLAMLVILFRMLIVVSWLPAVIVADGTNAKVFEPKIDESSKSELFEIAHEIAVLAPSQFPKPTRKVKDPDVVPIVEPTFGQHRPDQDVVMVRMNGGLSVACGLRGRTCDVKQPPRLFRKSNCSFDV